MKVFSQNELIRCSDDDVKIRMFIIKINEWLKTENIKHFYLKSLNFCLILIIFLECDFFFLIFFFLAH